LPPRAESAGQSQQGISFDRSTIDAFSSYLKNGTSENFEHLVSTPGSKLAYKHHLWSSPWPRLTIREFWKKQLEGIRWSERLEASTEEIIYSLKAREKHWLNPVLKYLPKGHVFHTTVYLIGGYDSIVYGEDVALNLNFKQYHLDHREATYYLIHELAHAGYFRYRPMPNLANLKTSRGLLEAVKLLTHLEGMGVVSSYELRIREGGLLDHDYKVLLNQRVRKARVADYFSRLARLEREPNRRLQKEGYRIFEDFSSRPKRLWYITGAHMALKIAEIYGTSRLREIVGKGHEAFFRTYAQIENPLHLH